VRGSIEPIETRYMGRRFRSRCEARYGVLMQALGLRWDYEWEGYALANGVWYLPDFWLSDLEVYVEVKGCAAQFQAPEMEKAKGLVQLKGFPVCVVLGPPALTSAEFGGMVYHTSRPGGDVRTELLAASPYGPLAWARGDSAVYQQAAEAALSARFEGAQRLILPGKSPTPRPVCPPLLACRQCGDAPRTTDAWLFTTSGLCPPCAVVDQIGRVRCVGCGARAYEEGDIREVLEELSDAWDDPQLALYVEDALVEREYHAVSPSCSQCSFAAVLCDLSAGGCPPGSATSPLGNGS
jgi:hypothetical protein